jgi:hypothetical protein
LPSTPENRTIVRSVSSGCSCGFRNGAPFKDWLLPSSLERVRRKLKGSADGDRQMVVMSVKVVEKRASEEVANGQAAMGGSFAGSASISGGVSSTIPSICMYEVDPDRGTAGAVF